MSSFAQTRRRGRLLVYFFLLLGAAVMIVPFVWMVLTSLKTVEESMRIPPTLLPDALIAQNYSRALSLLPFTNLYLNTALMIFWRIVCAVVFSSMAGYAFAKIPFRLRGLFFAVVVTQLMLPTQIFIIPQYQMLANLHLTNTVFALVFPGLVSAFGTFFLRQAFMGVPDEIIEAAKIDGCSQGRIFLQIALPLVGSALAALSVFTAVFAYGDLMWPLICNSDLNRMTLSAGLSTLRGQFTTNFPVLMAGSVLAMAPMVVLYLVFQRQFIEGIAMTGGK